MRHLAPLEGMVGQVVFGSARQSPVDRVRDFARSRVKQNLYRRERCAECAGSVVGIGKMSLVRQTDRRDVYM